MIRFLFFFLIIFSNNLWAWGWEDFKTEFSTPVTTSANKPLIYGTASVLTVLIFEDQIIDPIQEETSNDKPLGRLSPIGEIAGTTAPNLLYVIGHYFHGINGNPKSFERALGMIKATAYAGTVSTILKYTVRQSRPNNNSDKRSFPSGHTTSAFAFSGYVLEEHGWRWGVPALMLSSFTGASRINDNRHFLHDVLAGATIGLAYGIGISKYQKEKANEEQSVSIVPIWDNKARGIVFIKDF